MPDTMSAEEIVRRIEEIRARCEAATPGPWAHTYAGIKRFSANGHEMRICAPSLLIDADFIAHAREDIPYLLERIAELEGQLEAQGIKAATDAEKLINEMERYKHLYHSAKAQLSASQHREMAAVEAIRIAASGKCCQICSRDCIGYEDITACTAFEWCGPQEAGEGEHHVHST